jgi:glucokinase
MMNSKTLAIDLGGTNTKLAVVSKDLKILDEMEMPTHGNLGVEAAMQRWLAAIEPWIKGQNIDLIGIGSPGPLDTEKGMILETPNLRGWARFSFSDFFKSKLGLPCFIENDANCSALGEWSQYSVDDLICITLGTGVGVGIIASGKLVRGTKGMASQGGHMTIDTNGPLCNCGKPGCWEAFAGADSLVRRYNERAQPKVEKLTAHEIFNRARIGEGLATELIHEWTRAMAVAVGNLVNIFNPKKIVLTGGVSRSFHHIEGEFRRILVTQAFEDSLKCAEIVVSQLQNKAGLLGAAYSAASWAQKQV